MKNSLTSLNDSVYILAEIAQSYEGDESVLSKVIAGLKEAKADGAMFQVIYADEVASRNYDYFQLFESLEMKEEVWKKIVHQVQISGLDAVAEVFGENYLFHHLLPSKADSGTEIDFDKSRIY